MLLNHRSFLTTSAALLATPAIAAGDTPIIDTHTHFYDPTRTEGVPWPGKDDKILYRKVLPDEFKKLVKPHGVTGTVIVEASPWLKDNDWLLALAKDDPFVLGIVGNLSVSSDRLRETMRPFREYVKQFSMQPKFRGIRLNANTVNAADDLARKNIGLLADHDLTLDINGGPEMPPIAAKVAEEFPKLRIVVNHMANVKIDGKAPPTAWVDGLKAVAKHHQVWCKMSALVESSGQRDGKAPKDLAFYLPTLEILLKTLGEDRLIYGSDWPVSDHFATYATVFALADEFLSKQGKAVRAKVFGSNAIAAYKLKIG